jgi:hypothetical protein
MLQPAPLFWQSAPVEPPLDYMRVQPGRQPGTSPWPCAARRPPRSPSWATPPPAASTSRSPPSRVSQALGEGYSWLAEGAQLSLANSSVSSAAALVSGGCIAALAFSRLELPNVALTNCSAHISGGGIHLARDSELLAVNLSISSASAYTGAAVSVDSAVAGLSESSLSGNKVGRVNSRHHCVWCTGVWCTGVWCTGVWCVTLRLSLQRARARLLHLH